ncbi:hypothetical protein HDU93_001696 [Gonapodya sp. JEL0774]|nr:hypothetical protein HDU93_001696 [Gonapodya sp. JEL0774]
MAECATPQQAGFFVPTKLHGNWDIDESSSLKPLADINSNCWGWVEAMFTHSNPQFLDAPPSDNFVNLTVIQSIILMIGYSNSTEIMRLAKKDHCKLWDLADWIHYSPFIIPKSNTPLQTRAGPREFVEKPKVSDKRNGNSSEEESVGCKRSALEIHQMRGNGPSNGKKDSRKSPFAKAPVQEEARD